jgi:signal transduction histidine kinase
MKSTLFRTSFIVLCLVAISASILIFGTSFLVRSINRPNFSPREPLLFAHLIGHSQDPVKEVKNLKSLSKGGFSFLSFEIFDQGGNSLTGSHEKFDFSQIGEGPLPLMELIEVEKRLVSRPDREKGPAPHREDGPLRSVWISHIAAHPDLYLRIEAHRPPPPPGAARWMFWGSLLMTALTSALIGSAVLIIAFRSKAKVARGVISRLKQGDLKARLPSSKIKEISELLNSFNGMADEIERLIKNTREENLRQVHLLQDLAHDLRTPLSSLKSSMECLEEGVKDDGDRKLLFQYCHNEIEFTSRLVEDLLLLAQLHEPRYHASADKVDVVGLLAEELEKKKRIQGEISCRLEVAKDFRPKVLGDPVLIARLFRNALENAYEHTKDDIRISIEADEDFLILVLDDNGPGFSREQMEHYGQKRSSRYLAQREDVKKVSIGLGSVIIRSIVERHGGGVDARNFSEGKDRGARLVIRLPVIEV